MKKSIYFIIGLMALGFHGFGMSKAHASYCDKFTLETTYKQAYCDLRTDNNKKADKKVINIVADQYNLKEDLVEAILDDTACVKVQELEDSQNIGVKKVIEACNDEAVASRDINESLFIQNYINEVKNSYEKEKAMYLKSKALQMKFEASEEYWDGKALGPNGVPFDLSTDLNLIDIVLFGTRATWNNDVFQFPDKEDGDDSEKVESELPTTELEEGTPVDEDLETGGADITSDTGLPEGCVPLDDPNADPGAKADLFCGNNIIDVLMGEQCDDGNKENGDGCNQYCQEEDLGSNEICKDPEAITFKDPVKPDGESETPVCPEGSTISKFPEISGIGADSPSPVTQNPQYPGPTLGGTLKQFPESQRPVCPEGYSEFKTNGENGGVSAEGNETLGINVAGNQFDIPKCIPNQFCADLDAARDHLFGEGWEGDEAKSRSALSINALFCVNVLRENRPLSPYNPNEGCIDCHIRGINDSLAKTLEGNPTPKENTMSAFAISSRFGPNMSFNLNTGTKIVAQKNRKQSVQESKQKDTNSTKQKDETETPEDLSFEDRQKRQNQIIEERNRHNEELKIQTSINGSRSDIQLSARVTPLLRQMESIFESMHGKYNGLSELNFSNIQQCVIQ